MFKNLFNGKVGNIILIVNCIIMAIVFWFAVKYGITDGLSDAFGSLG